MRNINKKKSNIILNYYKFLCIFLLSFAIFFIFITTVSNYVYKTDIKSYMTSIILKPINCLKTYNLLNYKSLLKENKRLNREIINLKLENSNINTNNSDIDSFKKLSKADLYTDYNKIYSKVLYRNKMYWYSTITIDKGLSSGIKTGSLVVDKSGLVGIIKTSSKNNSTVELITNNSNDNKLSVGVRTKKGFKYGTIEFYKYPYLKVELTTDEGSIKENDMVITSGLGNLPKGIEIGKVKRIERDSYDLTSILYVEPLSDFNDINYVMVLVK